MYGGSERSSQLGRLSRIRLLFLTLFGLATVTVAAAPGSGQRERLARVRVPFVENCGQLDDRVAFSAPTFFGTVFVTRDGKLVYSLPKKGSAGWTLTETLVSGKPLPTAGARAVTGVSFFHGNDPKLWQSDLPTYDEVYLGHVWRGVTVSLRAHGGNVEKLFTIQPGARVEKIRLRVDGAKSLRIDAEGSLVAGTGNGEIRFTAPAAYQKQNGERRQVTAAYVRHGTRYGFRLGYYDHSLPVIVDPLLQSTYLGGGKGDSINAVTIHPTSGEVFVTGFTRSTDFPGTAGGAQPTAGGSQTDGFVARFNPALTTLVQATYLGGSGDDSANGIAVHPTSGEVLVAGDTTSTDFPGTTGGAEETSSGGQDGFVARLNPTLTALLQATYAGGSGGDLAHSIVIRPTSGEVLIAGETSSTDFPGTVGGVQPASGAGSSDGLVARLNASLTFLLQATYLGGSAGDLGSAIAIHPTSGEVLVTGATESTDFPGTAGGAQSTYGGGSYDAFIARLNPSLTTLLQTTYLGGSDLDAALGLTVHPTMGEVLVAGFTASTDFSKTAGGVQPAYGQGIFDGFVARLDATLTTVLQTTYLGGGDLDVAAGVTVHPTSGEVLVAGFTGSTDFPGITGGVQPAYGGSGNGLLGSDGFVARLNPTLTALLQATFLGGSGGDRAYGIAVHPTSGEVLVAGPTGSTDFPWTGGGAQPVSHGGGFFSGDDGFVARLTPDLAAIASPASLSVDVLPGPGDGDFVFEPGETVPVFTAWKNLSNASVTPIGHASAFSGPPSATYTILDDRASYSTIQPGAIGSCEAASDCYQVSASLFGGRPATHWDARFTERLSTRDYMFWALHIGDSFTDVPRNHLFYQKVEALLHHGITSGCTATTYCPDDPVTRAQMAIFIAKAIAGGGPKVPSSGMVSQSSYNCVDGGTSLFTDVAPAVIFCKHVHYLAAKNVTLGCGPSLYCPAPNVARGEMAIFIARAIVAPAGGAAIPLTYGPDSVTGLSYSCDAGSPNLHFTDVTTSDSFCKHVHYLWAKGIIGGCSATQYCPAPEVNRGAMAKFLANAFQLQLYGR